MNLPSREDIAKLVYPDVFEALEMAKKEYEGLRELNADLLDENDKKESVLKNQIATLQAIIDASIVKPNYFAKNFTKVDNLHYKQKRQWQKAQIDCEINQFIRPEQFEVQRLRKQIAANQKSLYNRVQTTATYTSKNYTWTDDKSISASGDYYLYPEEIIVSKRGDCEDHSFLLSSLVDGIYSAYGFYVEDNGNKFGHAFNVFEEDDKVYIVDTVGDTPVIRNYPDKNFDIYFIITKDSTYKLKGGVSFGILAEW